MGLEIEGKRRWRSNDPQLVAAGYVLPPPKSRSPISLLFAGQELLVFTEKLERLKNTTAHI